MMAIPEADLYCSDLSLAAGESMAGSATRVDVWLLLEYNGTWHKKATDDNDLPAEVQGWLGEQLASNTMARVQFVKQNRPGETDGLTFFLAVTRETAPLLYCFRLANYQELLGLNVAAALADDKEYRDYLVERPLYLVCTNGRRDRCCARAGVGLYNALAARLGDAVWQTTHTGGHRFAPTLVAFPDGTFYGRLRPEEVDAFLTSEAAGELTLTHLRGRCYYDPAVQAAEQFLREKTGDLRLNAYRFAAEMMEGHEVRAVVFQEREGEQHVVRVAQEAPEAQVVSCGPLKEKAEPHFRLVEYTNGRG